MIVKSFPSPWHLRSSHLTYTQLIGHPFKREEACHLLARVQSIAERSHDFRGHRAEVLVGPQGDRRLCPEEATLGLCWSNLLGGVHMCSSWLWKLQGWILGDSVSALISVRKFLFCLTDLEWVPFLQPWLIQEDTERIWWEWLCWFFNKLVNPWRTLFHLLDRPCRT